MARYHSDQKRRMPKEPSILEKGKQGYNSKMEELQNALLGLLDPRAVALEDGMQAKIARMAASPAALQAMKIGLPIAAAGGLAVAPAIEIGDNESYANQAMDLLGMGVGAYGMNYGLNRLGGTTAMIGPATKVGAQLQRPMARAGMIGAAGLGSLALSDAIQALVGGGEG